MGKHIPVTFTLEGLNFQDLVNIDDALFERIQFAKLQNDSADQSLIPRYEETRSKIRRVIDELVKLTK